MYNYEGIVIKTVDFKETSKIIYLYTSKGIDSLLVRGAKKNFSNNKAATQLLTKITYNKTNSNFSTLINFDVLNSYKNIKKDIMMLNYTEVVLEVLYKLKDDVDYHKAYQFLSMTLEKIDDGFDYKLLTDVFLVKYLYLLGLNPSFNNCVVCGKADIVAFSIKNGGVVCINHTDETCSNDIELITYLAKCYYANINEVDFESNKNALEFIMKYYKYHLNIYFKSYDMLNTNIFD